MKKNYIYYKVQLLKSKNGQGIYLFPKIKKHYGYIKYRDAVLSVKENLNYRDYFYKELFPKDINDIIPFDNIPIAFNYLDLTETNIVNEILCFLSFFSCYESELVKFDEMRNDYERNFLLGNYQEADSALEQIKKLYGFSFWFLESKMLCSQFVLNRATSEKFYQSLKTECNNSFIKTLTRALWRKVNIYEKYNDSFEFISRKISYINDVEKNTQDCFKTYFLYHFILHQTDTLAYNTIYELLLAASKLNLIDMYVLIDNIIVELLSSPLFGNGSKNKVLKYISELPFNLYNKKTSDLVNNKTTNDQTTALVYRLKRMLYDNTYIFDRNDIINITNCINSFEILHLCAKIEITSSLDLNIGGDFCLHLIKIIKKLYIKKCNYHEFIRIHNEANKMLLILDNTSLKYGYMNFLNDQLYSDTSYKTKANISSDYYMNISPYFDSNDLEELFISRWGLWESDWSHSVLPNNSLKYDNVSKTLLSITKANNISTSSYKYEIEHDYNGIESIVSNRYFEKLFDYYVSTNIEKAIELYVNLQFKSKLMVSCLDISAINKKCFGVTLKSLKNNINFCIFAHLTNFRGGNGLRFNRQASKSILSILKNNNISFPSELEIKECFSVLEKEKYIYLFRHVCEWELLLSTLTGYSINNSNEIERSETALIERIKLLRIALKLETNNHEKKEISYQIKQAENKLLSLKNSELEDYMVSSAKIFEDSISISDADIIFPFYENAKEILKECFKNNLSDFGSGEYLLFKTAFIKYKKAYINSLDNKIGVYIRHGYFKDEIISFFVKNNLAYKSIDSSLIKQNEINKKYSKKNQYTVERKKYFFSLKLYELIDNILGQIRIHHTSNQYNQNALDIYIDDYNISKISVRLINIDNPYKFKQLLNHEMSLILDEKLINLGKYISDSLYTKCNDLIYQFYPELSYDKDLSIAIVELANQIKKWFRFIRGGQELCLIDKYCNNLERKYKNTHCHISDNFSNEITLNKLHYLDLIFSNLIMNAEEHSGLFKDDLIISISLSIEDKNNKIYFKNNLGKTIDINRLKKTMQELEKNMKTKYVINEQEKGKGFYYIKNELDALTGVSWDLHFCFDELPHSFALYYLIDWGEVIV